MRRLFTWTLGFLLLFAAFVSCLTSWADDAAPPVASVAITDSGEPVVIPASPIIPPATSEQVGITLANLALHYPWIALLISVMGSARLWCKPLSQLVHWAIRQTKTTADDEFVAEVERSQAWVWFWWVVDYVASIKRDPPGTVVTVTKGSSGNAALFLVGALGISVMTVGCAGLAPSGEVLTPARVQQITRTAVFGTATVWTIKKPDSEPAFEAALRGIDALVAEERWDTAALASSLTSTGVHTFTGDEARLIIAGTTLAMETLGGSGVDLSNVEYARAVILGAQAGLRLALTGSAAPATH